MKKNRYLNSDILVCETREQYETLMKLLKEKPREINVEPSDHTFRPELWEK